MGWPWAAGIHILRIWCCGVASIRGGGVAAILGLLHIILLVLLDGRCVIHILNVSVMDSFSVLDIFLANLLFNVHFSFKLFYRHLDWAWSLGCCYNYWRLEISDILFIFQATFSLKSFYQ